jgi:hypothetical protein
VLLGGVVLAGCTRMVRVETGERITCTYGEVTTDTIKTIEVPSSDAAKYKVVRLTATCPRHQHLELLYFEAQQAILAGDLATAKAKLEEIVKTEPQFRLAKVQLELIAAGQKPVADAGAPKPGSDTTTTTEAKPPTKPGTNPGSGGTPAAPGQEPVGPVASLSGWVPEKLPGYTADAIVPEVFRLSREYVPSKDLPTDALIVVVEQYKDAAAAQLDIKNDLGGGFGTSSSKFTVKGREIFFGTDSHRFAIVAWNEGGLLLVIEASSKTGKPVDLKAHLTTLVEALVK